MSIECWLLTVGVGLLFANATYLLGRRFGYRQGRQKGLREFERRLQAREAYLEQRLQEYAQLLATAIHDNERLAAEVRDPADWWKKGDEAPSTF